MEIATVPFALIEREGVEPSLDGYKPPALTVVLTLHIGDHSRLFVARRHVYITTLSSICQYYFVMLYITPLYLMKQRLTAVVLSPLDTYTSSKFSTISHSLRL